MTDTFRRTLPLFNKQDRDLVQRLLHHAVEDLRYDHPDRKIARDLYHEAQEGDAIRLLVGTNLEGETLLVSPDEGDADIERMLDEFISHMRTESGEWPAIANELVEWREGVDMESNVEVAFEFLH